MANSSEDAQTVVSITRLLNHGREDAVFRAIESKLRRMVGWKINEDSQLQLTMVLDDAFLLALQSKKASGDEWSSREEFFAWFYKTTKRIVIDYRRRLSAIKAGGGFDRIELTSQNEPMTGQSSDATLDLLQALDQLEALDPDAHELLCQRFLSERSAEDIAKARGCVEGTVNRRISKALQQLRKLLGDGNE